MADIQERLRTALGAAYEIERELGGGGMSRVFLAREHELGRRVVVKLLPPELGAELNSDRFRREIQLAASLQHPHIVSVLTAGQADGLLYYTMPLIEGESLRDRLDREGELPIGVCIRILRDVVDALAYAHRHGVVHRDIKPGNILLTDQHAMVTDFGVAKALSAATDPSSLTSTGLVLGTPAYMAPEQAAADPHIDHRADLYAVGAVAYEMLTGQQPFRGVSVQAVLAAQLTRTPDPVSTYRQSVPPALATLVMRCLEKHPADRSQTADELKHELETIGGASVGATGDQSSAAGSAATGALNPRLRLLPVLALYVLLSIGVLAATRLATHELGLPDWVFPGAVVLLLIGLPIIATTAIVQRGSSTSSRARVRAPANSPRHWFTWRKAIMGGGLAFALWGIVVAGYMSMRALGIGPVGSLLAAGVLAPRERILVADFTNRSADSLLGGVATEAFRIDFAQSPVVNVLQPNYVREALSRMKKPGDTPLDLTLAREVAVREGIKAVIAGEISTAGTRFVLSARLVSAQTGEVFAAHRETAADSTAVIAAIDKLSEKLRERIGESLRTIRAGEPLEQVTTESLEALRKYTQGVRAVEREGDVARGTDLLDEAIALDTTFAMAYRKLGIHLSNSSQERARWVRALTKAFEYRDRLTERERYMVIGSYYSRVARDPEKTIAAYRSLLNTYPDDSPALNNLGVTYFELRQLERAEEMYRRATEADSTNRLSQTNLVGAQVATGKLAQAQITLDRAAAIFPNNPEVAYSRSALAVVRGDYAGAETALRELRAAQIESQYYRALTSRAFALLATVKGKLNEAERHFRDAMDAAEQQRAPQHYLTAVINLGYRDVAILNAPQAGVRRVDEALARHPLQTMAPLDRPYIELATFFALAGRPDRARVLRTERDSVIPPELHELWDPFAGKHVLAGAIAVADRRYDDAITEFRLADRGPCRFCILPYLGRAYDLAGEPDSTIAIYERYLATPQPFRVYPPVPNAGGIGDALFLAPIHKRLGELYDERGNRTKAADHYARFVDLWKDADPELRPAVTVARHRLARLSEEPTR